VSRSEYGVVRLSVLARVGRLAASRGEPEASMLLERTLNEANKSGLRLVAMECRLGLAIAAARRGAGLAELRRLATDAQAAGFLRMARLARAEMPAGS
jgi:hypothetical protein